eukprot:13129533-Ditylum_brightwellii.AAC.1
MFPNQLPYDIVWDRFRCLLKASVDPELDYKGRAVVLLSSTLKGDDRVVSGKSTAPYVCGKTKAFFRSGSLEKLESDRRLVRIKNACKLQTFAKAVVQRHKFCTMKLVVVRLQSLWRLKIIRRDYKEKI